MFAPGAALANDALLEDAFSARTKVLRPPQSGTCDAPTPEWLRGDWTVAASRFEGVSFPQSGSYYPRGGFTQTIAGARRGTILAIPNAGAAPKGYARSYASTLATSSDVTNAAAAAAVTVAAVVRSLNSGAAAQELRTPEKRCAGCAKTSGPLAATAIA